MRQGSYPSIPILGVICGLILMPAMLWGGGRQIAPDLQHRLNLITGYIYNDHFDSAAAAIDSLETLPGSKQFFFLFRTVLLQAQMMASESSDSESQLYLTCDSLRFYSEKLLESGNDSGLAYYCLGHSHAFRSLFKSRSGHWWAAIRGGMAAGKAYDKGRQIDPDFYDNAFGLGAYRYWKSVKTKLINWTPFFKNEKKNGMELLRLAVDSSTFSSDAARTALIWVYINEKRYGEALRLADLMQNKYQQGLTFIWAKGEIFYRLDDFRAAIKYYMIIFERKMDEPGNYYNLIEAAYYIVQSYRKGEISGEIPLDRVEKIAALISSELIPEETRKRQKKKLKKINSFLKSLATDNSP